MYDLIVIGGGPGGYVAAIRAAQLGGRVLLAEAGELGGTCLNRGCIPTKAMYHSAKLYSEAREGEQFGLSFEGLKLDFSAVASHRDGVVKTLVQGIHGLMEGNEIEVVNEKAELLAPGKVRLGAREEEAKAVIIATGSAQGKPPIPGIDSPGVVDTDAILHSEQLPQSLLVLGGGVVGVEFASIMSSFGVDVTLVEMLPGLLSTLDSELGRRLSVCLRKAGVKIHTGTKVSSIESGSGGLKVELEGKRGNQQVTVEQVLLAAGRMPNYGGIDLDGLGIGYERSGIVVDKTMATSVPGVWAIGDCVGGAMLAHVASMEGIVAAENAMGHRAEMDYTAVPSCVFTLPEVASVGLSEAEVKEQGLEYKVAKFPFAANGKALAQGDKEGIVKMVAAADGKILGVHIIGPHASDLIAEATVAVAKGITCEELAGIIHAHPTLAEAVAEAAHGLAGGYLHFQGR
ncbi:MAG: dihydrolipoyl dehydrogenase [Firmicutes bacterium]|nr:dihydrolipoyl dehydrogenase [Bacillota bacterium]